ncbi:MAG: hypothetical protein ACE5QW_06445, partial [Thermoplasmata archaeon]
MKPNISLLAVLSLLSILALFMTNVVKADGIDAQDLTIDVYAIDMFQLTNNTAFSITERIYFNNSGNSTFNGTVYSWLSPEAQVSSAACSSPSTMVLRVIDSTDFRCILFSAMESDEEIIAFSPFRNQEMLSYFGQNATLYLNASNENVTSWHSIPINITVGMGNQTRSSVQPGQGIMMTADQERMDARLLSESVIPENISANQTINVTNQTPWNQTISFSVDGLPIGWSAHIFDVSFEIDNITLLPNETKTLSFVVELPSYKTVIEISYLLELESKGTMRESVTFQQSFLYDITEYSLWLFTKKNYEVNVFPPGKYSHTSLPDQHPSTERDFHSIAGSPSAGESFQVVVEWQKGTEMPLWAVAAVALLIVIVAISFIIWRKTREEEPEKRIGVAEAAEKSIEAREARKEEILEALRETEAA